MSAEDASRGARPFVATYRLQLGPELTFTDAAALVPRLADLGVSHLYLSPVLAAVPGSTHGYDVVDHEHLSPDLGGREGWDALVATAHTHGLGLVVDIVPNHMATHPSNPAWWDVLRAGRASAYASWFDIFWEHGSDETPDRLLLPVLADHYGAALADGTIRLDTVDGDPVVRAGGVLLPLSAPTAASLRGVDPAEVSADRERLHAVLERQHYRLANWHTGSEALDYRRFFDVTDLIGVRADDPDVFAGTHRFVLDLVHAGDIDGVRVDHVDGIADPTAYTELLRAGVGDRWLVVEKILTGDEEVPAEWPVDGTTGYETSALIDALLVDSRAEKALTAAYEAYTGETDDVTAVVQQAKREVVQQLLPAELGRLAADLVDLSRHGVDRVDVSHGAAAAVVADLLVAMPVYRTYARPGRAMDERDAAIVQRIVPAVLAAGPHDPAVVDLARRALVDTPTDDDTERFRQRFQQTSGPVMAKGVEDTAFYRYARLVALNDVGGDPVRFGVSVDDFHTEQVRAAAHEPARMVTTSTHDSKRSEDVRARIAVLSEVPEQWAATSERWAARASVLGRDRDPLLEYLLLQTLVGAAPISAERLTAYAVKAAREAKRRTSWLAPDEGYERALTAAVARWLGDADARAALEELLAVVTGPGHHNARVAKLLALTVPGVPDLYQGSQWRTDALVDPDNRRPVDHDAVPTGESAAKEALVRVALAVRRAHPGAFAPGTGTYEPLLARGPAAEHAVAFVRGGEVITAVARLTVALGADGGWRTTSLALPDGAWRDVLDGRVHDGEVPAAELLAGGMALLVRV